MRSPSFTNEVQRDLSPMGRTPVLEQINTLPSPQSEAPLQDRNRKLHPGQDRADVRGHVIGAFVGVPILSGILRRQTVEKRLEIGANIWRGVFLYDQPRRSMPAKQGQEPGLHGMRPEPIQDFSRDLDEPGAVG